jgi:hypothetical protein
LIYDVTPSKPSAKIGFVVQSRCSLPKAREVAPDQVTIDLLRENIEKFVIIQ